MKKYFFDQDNDCHWFRIPAENRTEWDEWREIPDGDERGWIVPEFAIALGGGPRREEFWMED